MVHVCSHVAQLDFGRRRSSHQQSGQLTRGKSKRQQGKSDQTDIEPSCEQVVSLSTRSCLLISLLSFVRRRDPTKISGTCCVMGQSTTYSYMYISTLNLILADIVIQLDKRVSFNDWE